MRIIATTIAASLALAGCSSSTNSLLKDADPAACATGEVRSLVIQDIKNRVSFPDDLNNTPEVENLKKSWLDDVDVSLETITADEIDPSKQIVSCAARVKLVADAVEKPFYANVAWQLKANLATDDPLISLNGIDGRLAMGRVFLAMAAPLYKKQKEKEEIVLQQGREQFARENKMQTNAHFAKIKETYIANAFSDNQMKVMALYTMLDHSRHMYSERSNIDIPSWLTDVRNQLSMQNICSSSEDRFDRCEGDKQELVRTRISSPQQSATIADYEAAYKRCMFESLSEHGEELCALRDALKAKMISIGLCMEDDGGDGRWLPCAGVSNAP